MSMYRIATNHEVWVRQAGEEKAVRIAKGLNRDDADALMDAHMADWPAEIVIKTRAVRKPAKTMCEWTPAGGYRAINDYPAPPRLDRESTHEDLHGTATTGWCPDRGMVW